MVQNVADGRKPRFKARRHRRPISKRCESFVVGAPAVGKVHEVSFDYGNRAKPFEIVRRQFCKIWPISSGFLSRRGSRTPPLFRGCACLQIENNPLNKSSIHPLTSHKENKPGKRGKEGEETDRFVEIEGIADGYAERNLTSREWGSP